MTSLSSSDIDEWESLLMDHDDDFRRRELRSEFLREFALSVEFRRSEFRRSWHVQEERLLWWDGTHTKSESDMDTSLISSSLFEIDKSLLLFRRNERRNLVPMISAWVLTRSDIFSLSFFKYARELMFEKLKVFCSKNNNNDQFVSNTQITKGPKMRRGYDYLWLALPAR